MGYHETMSKMESIAAKAHAETISNAKASTKQAAEAAYHEASKQVSHTASALQMGCGKVASVAGDISVGSAIVGAAAFTLGGPFNPISDLALANAALTGGISFGATACEVGASYVSNSLNQSKATLSAASIIGHEFAQSTNPKKAAIGNAIGLASWTASKLSSPTDTGHENNNDNSSDGKGMHAAGDSNKEGGTAGASDESTNEGTSSTASDNT